MTGVWTTAAFFLIIMGGVMATGYWLERTPNGLTFESVGRVLIGTRSDKLLRRQLGAAGYSQGSVLSVFYGVRCSVALAMGIVFGLAALVTEGNPISTLATALAGALVGYLLPTVVLGRMARNRRSRLVRGLPAALEFCVLSLDAGQTLDQALIETSRGLQSSAPELSVELELTFLEARTGHHRASALRNLADRTDEPEMRRIVALLLDADRFGASIVPALRNHSKYLRLRVRQTAQEAARKVAVKLLFPVFFLIFPSVILVTLGPACIMIFNQMNLLLASN